MNLLSGTLGLLGFKIDPYMGVSKRDSVIGETALSVISIQKEVESLNSLVSSSKTASGKSIDGTSLITIMSDTDFYNSASFKSALLG